MSYPYSDCGLDYVCLENGYAYHDTPYGKGVSVADVEGLHSAIGQWIVEQPASLRGGELRFLRLQMDLTQRGLGNLLGTTEQTVRLWEKGRDKPIPGPADRLLRALYTEDFHRAGGIRAMAERLAGAGSDFRPVARMRATPSGWIAEAEIPAVMA